jgi:hypothetical protein
MVQVDVSGREVAMIKLAAIGMALAVSMPTMAIAGDEFGVFRFAPEVGTLGIGIGARMRINESWGTHGSINAFSFRYLYHDNKSDLHNEISLINGGASLDYHPWGGDFYLSAGARLSANKIKGKVTDLEGKVRVFGRKVDVLVPDPLTHYTVTQNALQPYLGLGYSYDLTDRVSVNFDFGALYAGKPDLDVVSHAGQFGFTRRQIDREIERARDRISPYQVLPVVQVGLKFRF